MNIEHITQLSGGYGPSWDESNDEIVFHPSDEWCIHFDRRIDSSPDFTIAMNELGHYYISNLVYVDTKEQVAEVILMCQTV